MQMKIFTVDAFTKRRFGGNSAAVCLVEEELTNELCQNIAKEMNLAETAFIRKRGYSDSFESGRKFGLRWFTTLHEVPLCGHATLSSAHVLFHHMNNPNLEISFETEFCGTLTCKKAEDGRIEMDVPLWDVIEFSGMTPDIQALAREYTKQLPVDEYQYCEAEGYKKLIIVLKNDVTMAQLKCLEPNMGKIAQMAPHSDVLRMVDLTLEGSQLNGCVNSEGKVYDFVSRIFDLPYYGGLEDPVTGSAHSALANYWWKRTKKTSFYARQASKRGGDLNLKIDETGNRLQIQGNAVTVIEGQITV